MSELCYIAVKSRAAVILLSESRLDDAVLGSKISIDTMLSGVSETKMEEVYACSLEATYLFSYTKDLESDGFEVWYDIPLP